MARSAVAIIGCGVAALVAAFSLGPVASVLWHATDWPRLTYSDWLALRFTVVQALLSASLSCLLAIPVAKALARRRFPLRNALITVMGAPFILPVIVAVLGLIAVFGRSGLINLGLASLGLPKVSIYGLSGVLLAHVFLNLPLAVRMILLGWQSIPSERLRLASSLGFGPAQTFRHLELPLLRAILPGAFLVIFVICLTSFAVALTLGGGPKATTVELAIYQAIRFDFDLGRAGMLAMVQFLTCTMTVVIGWKIAQPTGFGAGLDRPLLIAAPGGWRRVVDGLWIFGATAFLLVPILTVAVKGLPALMDLPPAVIEALYRSVAIAVTSALITGVLALSMALFAAKGGLWFWLTDVAATLPLATSALVLGVGMFLLARPFVSPADLALPVTVLANVILSLPFAYRLILPEAQSLSADYARLAASLNVTGIAYLRHIAIPRLARPLGFGTGLSAAFSMGDLGVIALFASDQSATLPLTIQRLMSAYRIEAAMGAAILLVVISFALFWAFDFWGRRRAAT